MRLCAAARTGALFAAVISCAPGHSFSSIAAGIVSSSGKVIKRSGAMNNGRGETDEDILDFSVPDDELERAAAVTDVRVITIAYCTQWYDCNWPL
jgi:hypothetical protein